MTVSDPLVALTCLAVLGHAHWFFGNLYEAIVLAPGWRSMADEPLSVGGGVLAPGSPVRYYVPITPLTVLVTVSAGIAGWRTPDGPHPALGLGVALSLISAAVTGYIVARVNLPLFFVADTPAEQKVMLARRWARLNYIRLTTLGATGTLLVWALTQASTR
ncbi:hypothetical protein [Cryptosporangium minutisporangium]|uniref:DUF1772 domain-containing protein n=1 Tax=Cryptosporangium minutisporangium TaxID=113569 RepID=A0ABP6SYA0_9ACTN